MAPGAHTFLGWWTANVLPLARRDRLLVFLGGVLPDLDGLGMFYSLKFHFTYHHVLCHNLFAGLAWAVVCGLLAVNRKVCVTLALLNWHLHLACDYFGSRGPRTEPPWILPYLYPLVGERTEEKFLGPAWYWNDWQWELNSWNNILVTWLAFAGVFYIAVRQGRTFFEYLFPHTDPKVCQALRKLVGAQGELGWSPREAKVIWRSYLLAAVAVTLACVTAASQAGRAP